MIAESILAGSLLVGANYADYQSTRDALSRGMIETNAIYGQQYERGFPIKMAATAGEYLIYRGLRKRSKTKAWIWVGTIVAANVVMAVHNHRAGR